MQAYSIRYYWDKDLTLTLENFLAFLSVFGIILKYFISDVARKEVMLSYYV